MHYIIVEVENLFFPGHTFRAAFRTTYIQLHSRRVHVLKPELIIHALHSSINKSHQVQKK